MTIHLESARPMAWCGSFHVQWCEPNDVWPRGGWSLYQISGDDIASRVVYEKGKGRTHIVKERHPWCGYLGMVETLEELRVGIEAVTRIEWKLSENGATRVRVASRA